MELSMLVYLGEIDLKVLGSGDLLKVKKQNQFIEPLELLLLSKLDPFSFRS